MFACSGEISTSGNVEDLLTPQARYWCISSLAGTCQVLHVYSQELDWFQWRRKVYFGAKGKQVLGAPDRKASSRLPRCALRKAKEDM